MARSCAGHNDGTTRSSDVGRDMQFQQVTQSNDGDRLHGALGEPLTRRVGPRCERARGEVVPVQPSRAQPVEPPEFNHMDALRSGGPRALESLNLLSRAWPDRDPRAVTRDQYKGA